MFARLREIAAREGENHRRGRAIWWSCPASAHEIDENNVELMCANHAETHRIGPTWCIECSCAFTKAADAVRSGQPLSCADGLRLARPHRATRRPCAIAKRGIASHPLRAQPVRAMGAAVRTPHAGERAHVGAHPRRHDRREHGARSLGVLWSRPGHVQCAPVFKVRRRCAPTPSAPL